MSEAQIRICEVTLVALNLAIWLGPVLLRSRGACRSLIQPAGMFPLFMCVIMGVSISEHWFGWSGRYVTQINFGIRRHTSVELFAYPDLFVYPLILHALAGIAYFAGVAIGQRRLVDGPRQWKVWMKLPFLPSTGRPRAGLILGVAVAVAICCCAPVVIFGDGAGFYWSVPLYFASIFVPLIVNRIGIRYGWTIYVFVAACLLYYPSKGNFIYLVVPWIVWHGLRIRITRRVWLLLFIIPVLYVGTMLLTKIKGEETDDGTLHKVVVREYGFEVFSILVRQRQLDGNYQRSWIRGEFSELVPNSLIGDKERMGQVVAQEFMPEDFDAMPEAGFYRHFLFGSYHDYGASGMLVFVALFGAVTAFLYDIFVKLAWRLRCAWPLALYLPIPVFSQFLANGSFSMGFLHILFGFAAIAMYIFSILLLTKRRPMRAFADHDVHEKVVH